MTLLAIDPSLNRSGIAWFNKEGVIEVSTIPVKKLKGSARLAYIKFEVSMYLDKVNPDTLVYEDYAFGARGRAIFQIGELGGVLKTLCYERGIDILLVPPATLKLFATDKGNADKDEVILGVQRRWHRYFETSDEADAYALLRLGEAYLDIRKRRAFSKKVRESLSKVEMINGKW